MQDGRGVWELERKRGDADLRDKLAELEVVAALLGQLELGIQIPVHHQVHDAGAGAHRIGVRGLVVFVLEHHARLGLFDRKLEVVVENCARRALKLEV